MPSGTRAANRAAMESEIRRLGREHLRTAGAAGLSLRAIARDLGVVSSAVYRYVPSRDDLLTMLLVEAYSDLADHVEHSVSTIPVDRYRERLRAATRALRTWAVDDPSRWALLYGSPVPGYAAPAEQTVGPGTRVVAMLIGELARAEAAGALRVDDVEVPGQLSGDLVAIRDEFGVGLSDAGAVVATTLWSTTVGAISLEVFGQYGADTFNHPGELFAAIVGRALAPVIA
ncbi:TetR family transcriptional regulator [Gordonia sp. HNM0687]|uniref:TetR family transcriptional regulator n=1 Tax=Gordonia mangrovi TaxID=2665643 RepID=A0A6L7GMI3_9ACTN|nr:TetR/AcrR family transcriptional regulator [Gordonia mangrovi]MXP21134.1 TetR family transcriptional regulator [Gordonia mangrovi]UVF78328.1 TetR/AcrR family transcriptional regulator [Gordonia mangrovi]